MLFLSVAVMLEQAEYIQGRDLGDISRVTFDESATTPCHRAVLAR